MMERSLRPMILMTLALAAGAGLPAQAAAFIRTYPVRHLNPDDAVMAVQVKLPGLRPDCRLMQDRAKDPRSSGIQGVILAECTSGKTDAEAHDRAAPERVKATLY